MADPRGRRSLTHVGGPITRGGDAGSSAALAFALDVASSTSSTEGEQAARAHVHGFHTYPARMHPTTARRIIEAFSRQGDLVLDPFCGSGTVLVEARSAGRRAFGSDLNPLAVLLARRKVTPAAESERRALVEAAVAVADVAATRRKAKAGSSRRYGPDDVAAFDPHVLLELDGLKVGLAAAPAGRVMDTLALVLSSILIKLSKQAGDTSRVAKPTRIAAGYPSRLFVKKTEELAASLAEIAPALERGPDARVEQSDARDLRSVAAGSVELVLTSPPYAGVYDYLEHHRLRLRWLGMSERELSKHEIGARRDLSKLDGRAAEAEFARQLGDVLAALGRVLTARGRVVLLVADGAIGKSHIRADDLVEQVARKNRFAVSAVGSQSRPHFHGPSSRAFARNQKLEHAVLLVRKEDR